MKIKKYFAADMRQALNLARQEQGPDVVILGNRKVLGGVELIAAEDYDEKLFDGQDLAREIKQAASHLSDPQETKPQTPAGKDGVETQEENIAAGKFWSREPSLDLVQQEINSLRKLLEQQMSGLAWGDVGRSHPLWALLLRKLGDLGIRPAIARQIVEQIPEHYSQDKAWRTALALLSYRIPVCNDNFLSHEGVIAFAGASGTGKTTTIAKLAAKFVLDNNASDVVLATLDSYRVGGREQLGSYARIIGVPLRTIHNQEDMSELLDQFYGRKLILIDTAGLSPQDLRQSNQINILRSANFPIRLCLVLSATSQVVTLKQVFETYRELKPDTCVLTKLDEANSIGSLLSVVIDEGLKIAYQCSGQQVPEDLAKAESTDLIARSITMQKKFSDGSEDQHIEQSFGKYTVYNPIGGHNGR